MVKGRLPLSARRYTQRQREKETLTGKKLLFTQMLQHAGRQKKGYLCLASMVNKAAGGARSEDVEDAVVTQRRRPEV